MGKLKLHEATQHTAPFRCRFCNSFFTILKFYKIHLRLHVQHAQKFKQNNSRVPDNNNHHHHVKTTSSSTTTTTTATTTTNNGNDNDTIDNLHHNYKQSKQSGSKNDNFYTPNAAPAVVLPPSSTATATTTIKPSSQAAAVQSYNHGLLAHLYGSTQKSPLTCKYCNKSFGKFSILRKHEMLHKMNNFKIASEIEVDPVATLYNNNSKRLSSGSSSALTLTPSLLSNLNKLATLKSNESGNDGSAASAGGGAKPAILININTNDSAPKPDAAKKSQEMPLNSNSGLMISSVSSVGKSYFDDLEKQRLASNATVFIQNGKKAVSLADLQCPICKKIVSQPFSLKVHLRTHTLEK